MSEHNPEQRRRRLPAVSRVLEQPALVDLLATSPRSVVVDAVRRTLADARSEVEAGADVPSAAQAADAAATVARSVLRRSLRRAINATGIVLHTGLGRAVLPEAACRAVAEVAAGHALVELDPDTGQRGSRQAHCRSLLTELSGAGSALVVNNNAAAVLLCVSALAAGGEVILSRGEMVEIGGSFRLPDIVRASGATLVEVGTTNRTRLSDYVDAVTDRTRLILRCHPSNFRIVGYTGAPSIAELVGLGENHGIPVVDDLGSGAAVDTAQLGAGPATTLRAAVQAGAAIVTASGDKLLGGPQAGIVLGRAELIRRIASHPIARAVRCDKLTLAALEATLRLYRDPPRAMAAIPTLRYLARTSEEIRDQAERVLSMLAAALGGEFRADAVESQSQVGGGSLPGEDLPTWCVRLRPVGDVSADALAAALRQGEPAVLGRIRDDALHLDLRTVERSEEQALVAAIGAACDRLASGSRK